MSYLGRSSGLVVGEGEGGGGLDLLCPFAALPLLGGLDGPGQPATFARLALVCVSRLMAQKQLGLDNKIDTYYINLQCPLRRWRAYEKIQMFKGIPV